MDLFRTGKSVGRTVYIVNDDDGDMLIGVLDTRELADFAVRAMNDAVRRGSTRRAGAGIAVRTFQLYRREDETGISGTGIVAEGVEFSDGACAMRWCTVGAPVSTAIYDNAGHVEAIHGHGGKSVIIWAA